MFNQTQIDHLLSLRFINNIDKHLKIISAVKTVNDSDDVLERVVLVLDIFHDGEKIDVLSFDLHNFSYEEVVEVAGNIGDNDFIMREVDIYLDGDIE